MQRPGTFVRGLAIIDKQNQMSQSSAFDVDAVLAVTALDMFFCLKSIQYICHISYV